MNIEANSNRIDEIVFPHDMTMIMQKVNAQIVEFNSQGTLVAIGCKYGSLLIMDFMTKEIVRCFSLYEDYDLEANQDVDQFSHFRRLNYAYLEDDFILHQKPQDEKESESIVKRGGDFKKIIQFEPKDKSKCKAAISSIDWSIDSKLIAVCFKVENQVIVWNTETCQKVYHLTQQQLNPHNIIHYAYFYSLNPNYLLISGDRSMLINIKSEKVNLQDQMVLAAEKTSPDSSIKLEGSPSQIISGKRKGPKFSAYIFQSLFINENRYYLLVNNYLKVIFLLKDRNEEQTDNAFQISDFFYVIKNNKKMDESPSVEMSSGENNEEQKNKMEIDQQIGGKETEKQYHQIEEDEESKGDSTEERDEDLDRIKAEDVDIIQDAVDCINQKIFKIVAIQKFQSQNSFVQSMALNDNATHFLLSCSDRVLRLYEIKDEYINQQKKVIYLKNEFNDVINRRKWMNACFLKLNNNTRLIIQSQNKNDINEAFKTTSAFISKGNDDINNNLENIPKDMQSDAHELFVSSIGESGSNELKFFNVHDFSTVQRLELSQEGCSYLSAHSKSHFSIAMVTTNGSLFLWSVRPAKIIQPLAPGFVEIDDNKEYIEREDEFEKELSDPEEFGGYEDIKINGKIDEEKKKQKKLARNKIDIENTDPFHLCNRNQILIQKRPDLILLKHVFIEKEEDFCKEADSFKYNGFMTYLQVSVLPNDSYGLLAKHNIDCIRDKFKKVFNQS